MADRERAMSDRTNPRDRAAEIFPGSAITGAEEDHGLRPVNQPAASPRVSGDLVAVGQQGAGQGRTVFCRFPAGSRRGTDSGRDQTRRWHRWFTEPLYELRSEQHEPLTGRLDEWLQ